MGFMLPAAQHLRKIRFDINKEPQQRTYLLRCSLLLKANAFEGAANTSERMIHLCRRGRRRISRTWLITWRINSATELMILHLSLSLPGYV